MNRYLFNNKPRCNAGVKTYALKQETLQLTGANYNGNRRALDFYPTPPEVTVALMKFIKLDRCTVWECAAGNGAMANVIKTFGHTVIETDILTGNDFLKTNIEADAIITNPPFNLSDLFIEKAVKESGVVCMLLKSQYWHARKRYDLFKIATPAYILPLTWRPDFLQHERKDGSKGSPTMEVIWTVWEKGSNEAKYIPLLKP